MVSSLSVLRTAIDSYWTQHDKFPGQGGPEEFADQLIKATNKAGTTGAGTGFGYGPYLRNGKLPLNPLTGTSTVRIVTAMPTEPTGTEAWIYASTTGEILSLIHISEPTRLLSISYAVFCLKKKK